VADAPIDLELLLRAHDPVVLDAAFEEIFRVVDDGRTSGNLARGEHLIAWAACSHVVTQLHVEVLLACLRLTYEVREGIPSWSELLEATERELTVRGEDVDALLHGLREGIVETGDPLAPDLQSLSPRAGCDGGRGAPPRAGIFEPRRRRGRARDRHLSSKTKDRR